MRANLLHAFRDPVFLLALAAGPAGAIVWTWLLGEAAGDPAVWGAWVLVLMLLIAPVVEELAFRGLIQGLLLRPRWGRWRAGPLSVANILTTLAFAASHWPRGGALLAAGVMLPGLVFGYFRERHDGLWSPILLHAWYNLSLVLVLLAWPALP